MDGKKMFYGEGWVKDDDVKLMWGIVVVLRIEFEGW